MMKADKQGAMDVPKKYVKIEDAAALATHMTS